MILNDSLKKRYLYKLGANVVSLGINIVTQSIIPRGLGPKFYGDFHFLTNFFQQFVGFFDIGTSLGFYTKLSQRPNEHGLVTFYFYFFGISSVVIIGILWIISSSSFQQSIWPNQKVIYYIFLVFGV